jgi:transposase
VIARIRGLDFSGESIKRFRIDFVERLFESHHHRFTAERNRSTIQFLGGIIREIETEVRSQVELRKDFQLLLTTPGIGLVLGLTIMLEVGDINRFPKVGDYSSYCRCVESKRISNNKKKGEGNKKNGNRYLAWAYVEAANHASRVFRRLTNSFSERWPRATELLLSKHWLIS